MKVNMREVEKFPLSRRARAAVVRFCKNNLPALPEGKIYKAAKKIFFGLGKGKEEKFEFRPVKWTVSIVTVKKGRIHINLYLDWKFVRLSDNSELHYHQKWHLHQYDGLHGLEDNLSKVVVGLDTGIQVLPLNSQQGKFLLKKDSGQLWGLTEDLEELKKAPDGLFCPHVTQ